MKNFFRALGAIAATSVLGACPHYVAPTVHPVPAQFVVHASVDTTWAVLESYVASVHAPVDLADRRAGTLSLKPMPADPAWLDCGKMDDGMLLSTKELSRTMRVSIAITALADDSTAVRINVSGKEQASQKVVGQDDGSETEFDCTSTGVFEGEFLRWVDGEIGEPGAG